MTKLGGNALFKLLAHLDVARFYLAAGKTSEQAETAKDVWLLLCRLILATTALPSGHRMPAKRRKGARSRSSKAVPSADREPEAFYMKPETFKFLSDYWVYKVRFLTYAWYHSFVALVPMS